MTLQLGLRYEYQTPTSHLRDVLYNFDPVSGQVLLASEKSPGAVSRLFNRAIPIAVADGTRFPRGQLWRSDRNNLAPRLGFAFRLRASNDLVVRGAYGIYYDTVGIGVASLVPRHEGDAASPSAQHQSPSAELDTVRAEPPAVPAAARYPAGRSGGQQHLPRAAARGEAALRRPRL